MSGLIDGPKCNSAVENIGCVTVALAGKGMSGWTTDASGNLTDERGVAKVDMMRETYCVVLLHED